MNPSNSVVASCPCSCLCHRPGMKTAHAVACCKNSGRTWDGEWVERVPSELRQRVLDAIPKEQQKVIEDQYQRIEAAKAECAHYLRPGGQDYERTMVVALARKVIAALDGKESTLD